MGVVLEHPERTLTLQMEYTWEVTGSYWFPQGVRRPRRWDSIKPPPAEQAWRRCQLYQLDIFLACYFGEVWVRAWKDFQQSSAA